MNDIAKPCVVEEKVIEVKVMATTNAGLDKMESKVRSHNKKRHIRQATLSLGTKKGGTNSMEVAVSIPPMTTSQEAQELPKSNTKQQKTSRSRDNNSRKEEQRHSREEVREEPGPASPISADWLRDPFMALEVGIRKLQQTVTTTETIQKEELLAVTTVEKAHQKKEKELKNTNKEGKRKQSRSKSYASFFTSKKGKSILHASPEGDTVKEETQSSQQETQEHHELQAMTSWMWSLFMFPEEEQGQPEETIVMIMDEEEDNNNNNKNSSRKWGFRNKNNKNSFAKASKTTQEVDTEHSEKKKNAQWKAKAIKAPKLDERQDAFAIRNDGQRKHRTKKSSNKKRQKNTTIMLEESRDDALVPSVSRRSRHTAPADGQAKLNSRPTRRSSNNMTRRSSSTRRHRQPPEINILSYASPKGTGQEMLLLTEMPKEKKKKNQEHGNLVRSMLHNSNIIC
jgi:hypothetical protein